ncbi:MAG TPA: ABC transporter substrate-binding protein [Solirubrobacteraceae bacterium]|nr:ABC transporter substrate-binding protein [Solirubrobacteraceae bacterium]
MRRLMVRLGNLLKRTLAPAAICALVIAGCGSQEKPHAAATGTTTTAAADNHSVWIYSSLPEGGPERAQATQIRAGIKLALGSIQKRYHGFQIRYLALNDSLIRHVSRRGNTNGWNPSATVRDAERAARNPQTIAYIGDLSSGATELSLPILNQAGIAQITPGSGYPGLTDSYSPSKGIAITQPGEPARYYPQSPRNLLRMIPSDIVQASAVLSLLHKGGCPTVAAWEFGGTPENAPETAALLGAVARTAPLYGMKYVPPPKLPPSTKSYVTYTSATLKPLNIRCAVLVGRVTPAAEMFTTELREQLGASLPVVGTDGFCTASWARGIAKPYAKEVLPGLYCTTPALPIRRYPKSAGFVAKFVGAFHQRPTAYSYYGYEAAEMVLRVLRDVASADDARKQVLLGLVQEFVPDQPVPAFTFINGSVESTRYGIEHFNAGGLPVYYKTVAPTPLYLLPSAG